jgi:nucleotide-binding universal stress UspA family protein
MKTILLPTDFSANANHATDFAVSLSKLLKARLVMMHTLQYPVATTDMGIPVGAMDLFEAEKENAQNGLKEAETRLREKYKDDPDAWSSLETYLAYGSIVDGILDTAQEVSANYIVVGKIGASVALDTVFGSIALALTRQSKYPVWVIPQEAKIHDIDSILYFADLEGDEISCVRKVIDMADTINASSTKVVHIHEEFEPEVFSSHKIIKLLEDYFSDEPVTFRNLNREDSLLAIDHYIVNQKPDAVVLAHHQRGWLMNLLHKSVIKHLAHTIKLPMLVLHKQV